MQGMDQHPENKRGLGLPQPPDDFDFDYSDENVALATIGESIGKYKGQLTASDWWVYVTYLLRFNGSPGSAYPGNRSIAEFTGLSVRSVSKSRTKLINMGLIRCRKKATNRRPGRFSVNQLKWPFKGYRSRCWVEE